MSDDFSRLAELKAYRRMIFEQDRDWRSAFRRKLQTWDCGLPKGELLTHLCKLLIRDLHLRMAPAWNKPAPLPMTGNRPLFIAKIGGGLGDLVVAARFLARLSEVSDTEFVVEYRNPAVADFVFGNCERYLTSASAAFDNTNPRCVASLDIGILITVDFLMPSASPALCTALNSAVEFAIGYNTFTAVSPFLDGALGDALVSTGIRRHRVGFAQTGLPYPDEDFLRPAEESLREFLRSESLTARKYITISDGWDADFGLLNGRRPTKALLVETLERIVRTLRSYRSDLAVVQVGAGTSGVDINGADRNFRGKTSLSECVMLLAGATLHIDTEGGLVHLARSVGTPAAVFFGPTSAGFFAYEDNLALLPPDKCNDCYWSTNTWMAICPLKKDTICMQSHDADDASQAILRYLAEIEARGFRREPPRFAA
jgi:hypothetical protein